MQNQLSLHPSLRSWQYDLANYILPKWDELPNLELYMDQVVALLKQYLTILSADEHDQVITASSINNYVRLKLMPPPYKKRYSRLHLAYLVVICTLKQSMSIADIQKILPANLPVEEVPQAYDEFVSNHAKTSMYFLEQLRTFDIGDDVNSLKVFINKSVIVGGLIQLLNSKLLSICTSENNE